MSEKTYPKFRWFVLITIVLATLAQGMILIAPSPLIGEVAKTLNMDLGVATAAAMLPFTLFVAIGGMLGGVSLDKLGPARTFLACSFVVALSGFLTPVFGGSVFGLVILRALQGLGCGPIIASGPRLASEWFPQKQRGMFQGVQGAALSLGITIGLMAGPQIAAGAGWQTVLVFFGGVMALACVLFVIYAFGPKAPSMSLNEHAAGDDFKKVFSLPVFWMTLLSVFSLSWVMQGYNDLTPGHIAVAAPAGLGFGPQVAGSVMGIYTLAFMIGSIASGFVAEKIFGGRYKTLISVSFVLTAAFCGSVMLPFVNGNVATLTICLILAGFFMGMPNPVAMTFIANHYPENITGRVGGLTMGLSIFGGTIAVGAGSFALHATGMYTVSILIVVVVALIGAGAGFGIKAPRAFAKK